MKKTIIILFILCIFILPISSYFPKIKSPLIDFMPITLFQIQSGSMVPTIKQKEIIIVCRKEKYKENDIITYKLANNYITHRIKKVTQEGFITKGDFNNTEDEEIIKLEQIQGKVIFHTILLGKLFQYRYYIILSLAFLYCLKYFSNLIYINKKGGKNASKSKTEKNNKKR